MQQKFQQQQYTILITNEVQGSLEKVKMCNLKMIVYKEIVLKWINYTMITNVVMKGLNIYSEND